MPWFLSSIKEAGEWESQKAHRMCTEDSGAQAQAQSEHLTLYKGISLKRASMYSLYRMCIPTVFIKPVNSQMWLLEHLRKQNLVTSLTAPLGMVRADISAD